jgi:HD-GYP domain-containing protein (c-di-GMP phosphodiesterase class II)
MSEEKTKSQGDRNTEGERGKVPFFSRISKEDYDLISGFGREKQFLPGDVIVREKTLTDTFCIIQGGRVEITKKFSDGDEMVLTTMDSGDFFGEMALLDQAPRSATVRALSQVTILELSRDDFEALLQKAPSLAYGIMQELGRRLRETGSLLVAHLEKKNTELSQAYLSTVHALVHALEARDPYTSGHTTRVTAIAKIIARHLDIIDEDLFALEIGALLHDMGKIGIPDAILRKPGPLTSEEYDLIMEHPQKGESILKNVEYLERSISSILFHHERFDGEGYPRGMKGEDIPLFGRIIAVADSLDAMITDRPYRKKRPLAEAIEELKRESDKQFDRRVVSAFLDAWENGEIDEILTKYSEIIGPEQAREGRDERSPH